MKSLSSTRPPATEIPLWQQSIENLASQIKNGSLTPIALVNSVHERIDRYDELLGSFVCVSDSAFAQAERLGNEIQDGHYRGPLHGIPVAIKDNYLTADLPTAAGSDAPDVEFPKRDAGAVARLREAGAIVIGKTQMHEFAWGTVTPKTSNPWNRAHIPGGSSGGSGAAVAAGLCPAALGSDTGGSIRIPASACGTVGFKPSFGRISRDGIVPHSWSLDHAGPLCRTVADAALLLNVMAGFDPADMACSQQVVPDYTLALNQSIDGLRVGICRDHFFERLQPDVASAIDAAVQFYRDSGATIVEFNSPNMQFGLAAIFAIELASSSAYHGTRLRNRMTHHLQDDVRELIEMGNFISATDYLKAEQLRRQLMTEYAEVLQQVDVIVSPTMPLTAWAQDETIVEINGEPESVLAASWRLTYPWNLTGMPAISIPCGFDNKGLPIGLQIAGQVFDESSVLKAAHAYEQAHDWSAKFPVLD